MKSSIQGIALAVVATAAVAAAVGQFQQRQAVARLAARLDRMELDVARYAPQGDQVGATGAAANPSRNGTRSWVTVRRPDELSLEDPQARNRLVENSRKQLESTYASEPIDAAWAGTTMRSVEDAIVNVAAEGAPTPEAAQVDCRSQTCRIRLSLADHDQSSRFIDPLLAKFAKELPVTQSVEVPSADGKGFDVLIYATAR